MIEFDGFLLNENNFVKFWVTEISTYPDVPSYMNCCNLKKVVNYSIMGTTINGVDVVLEKFDSLEEVSSCYVLLKEKLNAI